MQHTSCKTQQRIAHKHACREWLAAAAALSRNDRTAAAVKPFSRNHGHTKKTILLHAITIGFPRTKYNSLGPLGATPGTPPLRQAKCVEDHLSQKCQSLATPKTPSCLKQREPTFQFGTGTLSTPPLTWPGLS